MDRTSSQAIFYSVLLHIAFITLAALFIFFERWLEEPEPVVFELVAAQAAPAAVVRERPEELVEPLPPLDVEEPEPIRPLPEVPDVAPPEPEPEPEPAPLPRVDFEEWSRNREMPDRVQRVQRQRQQPVTAVPEIETGLRDRLEEQIASIQIEGTLATNLEDQSELQRYLAQLRARIQEAFDPSGSNLEAEAYFLVTAGGAIRDARLNRSSGVAAFDQSVLRTLRAVRSPGPPPGGQDYTFSLVFRSE